MNMKLQQIIGSGSLKKPNHKQIHLVTILYAGIAVFPSRLREESPVEQVFQEFCR